MPILEFTDESTTKKLLKIEVPAESAREVEGEVVAAFRAHAKVPGFRPGHVPANVIRKRYADEIRREVIEKLLPESLFAALREKALDPVLSPEVADIELDGDGPLRYRAVVEVRPPIELGVYRGLPLPDVSTEPTDEEIQATLDGLRERVAQFVPIENRPIANGDFAVLDVHGEFPAGDGEPFDDEKVFVEVGAPGNLPELNDLLPSLERGETLTFERAFPADDEKSGEFAGKTVAYRVHLVEIKEKQLPELDDDFAKSSGLGETFDEVRGRVVASVRRRREEAAREARRRAILDRLREAHSFDLPEGLVEEQIERSLRQIAHDIAHQGVDPAEAGVDWKKLREEVRPGAAQRVAERLILEAIADREGIAVSDPELDAQVRHLARSLDRDSLELRTELAKNGGLDALRDDMRRDRTLSQLVEWAQQPA